MSGGFFRGTSADQDTRFSNKQAKLLKSQKFAPELDHLVDMTKVKMDVMRPWIATRVTELLGFEDEVLINFIYGLLDVKEVNGKEVQISLTGFMEKNTGKFMKELWSLLLSAQKNASGVPQQFLDAKEEETKKKKAETDRIENDFKRQRDKETWELEMGRMKKMDGELDSRDKDDAVLDQNSKNQPRASGTPLADNKEKNERIGSKARSSGRQRSRSISGSPQPRGRSISSETVYDSPPRRSVTPRRRISLSPLTRRSSHSKRRSTSRSHHRSPSPPRRRLRSPVRDRSRSPIRRRPRFPIRRRSRSPIRGRSRSPIWRRSRSPLRHRSRSPLRRRLRSPIRRRSPSPIHRRSRSPIHRRSRSPIQQRSPSSVRRRYQRSPSTPSQISLSPVRHRSAGRRRSRSPLPQELSSSSPSRHISPSPDRRSSLKRMRSSPRGRIRSNEKYSPVGRALPTEDLKRKVKSFERSDSLQRQPSKNLRDQNNSRRRIKGFSPSPSKSLSVSESPPTARRRTPSEDRRSFSPYGSAVKQTRESMSPVGSRRPQNLNGQQNLNEQKSHCYSPDTVEEEVRHARADQKYRDSVKMSFNVSMANERNVSVIHNFDETQSLRGSGELQKKDLEMSEIGPARVHHPKAHDKKMTLINHIGASSDERREETYSGQGHKADEKNLKCSDQHHKSETMSKLSSKVEQHDHNGSVDSGTEESDKVRTGPKEKRKHKRSRRREVATDDDDSYDSLIEEGRKEAKKRRKEEKKQRKEERRRRREERRRRREERRKLKLKSVSDFESNRDDNYASAGEHVSRRDSRADDIQEDSDPKKLEIELREKALETLRARKGIGH